MSEILLPRRFKSQPQYAAPLDKGHPLYQDLLFAYSAGRGALDGRHPDLRGAVTGTVPYVFGLKGKGILPADGTSYLGFADNADYNWLGDITIIAQIKVGGTTVQQGIVTKCETGGGTNTPFALLTEIGGALSFNRSNSGFRVWASSATLSAGQLVTVVVTQVADISVTPKFYINGVIDAGSATSLYGGTGTGAPTGNTTSIKLGNRTDLASRCYHEIYDVAIIKRVLSGGEVASAYGNFKDIWQAKPRRLWAVSAVTGSVALTGQSLTSAQGTLAPSTSVALTGQSLTSAQGTLTPGTDKALTGQSLTSAQGTLAPSTSVALTGQALTAGQGTLAVAGSADVTVALSGQALTFGQGSLGFTKSGSLALTGQAATTAQGTLFPATAVALSGQAATSAQGTLVPATSVALSGQALTSSQGTLAPSATGQSITIQLTGISLTSYQGSLSLDQYIWDTTQGRAQPGRGTFRPLKPHEMSEPEIVVVDIPDEESTCEYVPAPLAKPTKTGPRAGISGIKLPPRRQPTTTLAPAQNRDYKALMARAGKPQKTMKLSDFPITKNKKYLTKTRGQATLKGN